MAEARPHGTWHVAPARTGAIGAVADVREHLPLVPPLALQALRRRYRRTILGWPWLLIRPLVTALAGTLLFAGVLGLQTGAIPYILFFSVGMTVWSIINVGLIWCTRSLEMNRRLLSEVHFPRVLLPVSHLFPAVVEFAVFLLVSLALLAGYAATGRFSPPVDERLLLAPVAVLFTFLLVLAIGLSTSVIGARSRDLRFSLPYIVQVWLFATPVIYPLSRIPSEAQVLLYLNPASLPVVLFRHAVLGDVPPPSGVILGNSIVLVVVLGIGLYVFHRSRHVRLDNV